MRAYVPVSWEQLAALHATGAIAGPLRACIVDPAWRAGAPEADEEEWEYEAQSAAAASVDGDGVVLAVEAPAASGGVPDEGWVVLAGPVGREEVAAVLTADLAWYGVQEIGPLLAGR